MVLCTSLQLHTWLCRLLAWWGRCCTVVTFVAEVERLIRCVKNCTCLYTVELYINTWKILFFVSASLPLVCSTIPLFPLDVDFKNENVQQAWVCYIFSACLCPLLTQKPLILLSLLALVAPLVSAFTITLPPNINSGGSVTIGWTVGAGDPYVNHPFPFIFLTAFQRHFFDWAHQLVIQRWLRHRQQCWRVDPEYYLNNTNCSVRVCRAWLHSLLCFWLVVS